MKITIEIIPHDQQRYDTVGDWIFVGDELIIKVSEFKEKEKALNESYTLLIGIHELIEAVLCRSSFITQEMVDYWDMSHLDFDGEPGEIVGCPYYRQHLIATIIEHMIADELGINWEDYEEAIENL